MPGVSRFRTGGAQVACGGSIVFLGTGNAFQEDGRGAAATLVQPAGRGALLIDAGPTVLAAMTRSRVDAGGVDCVLLTHLHGDHIAGWPFLVLDWTFRLQRREPVTVVGPPGTEQTLRGLERLCYAEMERQRTFEVNFVELEVAEREGVDLGADRWLDVVPVEHHPTSLGLRLRIDGRGGAVFALSGDTRWCAGLERLARGAALLALECTTTARTETAHVSLEELREGRSKLEADRVVIVHLPDAVAEALARDPLPGVLVAHDGLRLEYPAG